MKETIEQTLSRLAPGVRPAPGEPLVFFVLSKSAAGVERRVDFNDFKPNGSCTCENFLGFGKMEKKLRNGEPCGPATECEHLRRANRYLNLVMKWKLAHAVETGNHAAVEELTTVETFIPAF